MNRDTFVFHRPASLPGSFPLPLIVNEGHPSESRLIARGDRVFIYHYTRLDNPRRAGKKHPTTFAQHEQAATGRIPATTPHHQPHMKKTPMKGAVKGAAMGAAKGAVKGAMKGAAKGAAASKGYGKK